MPSTDTLIARLALSLWSSDRRVEPLPTVRVWEPSDTVRLVAPPAHLLPATVYGLLMAEGV